MAPIEAQLIVVGAPANDSTTGALRGGGASGVNNAGYAVGNSGSGTGDRAVRWDASGTTATVLGNLGTNGGFTHTYVYAINDSGTAVGGSWKYVSGNNVGSRAVRWSQMGTAATELGHLGTDNNGSTLATALAINDAGQTVGYAYAYDSGNLVGERAVRWEASATAATMLGHLGTNNNGFTEARAYAVNDSGTAVGYSRKYVFGNSKGKRAVRWDSSGTTATELGNLGLDPSGSTLSEAIAVNSSGTAVGWAKKHLSEGDGGYRPVRWDAAGIEATELEILGTRSDGWTDAYVIAVNDAGTAVGHLEKYVSGMFVGKRAARWNASGVAVIELANLGTDANGYTWAAALGMNGAGTAVGFSEKYISGSYVGNRAVIWLPDASVIDLNDLGVVAQPFEGTWLLSMAYAMSSDGWVAGTGRFTPTVGSIYDRHWVTQVGLGGTWTDAISGSLNGTWGRGPQWSTGTPAMRVGNASFSANAAYTVSLDRDETTRNIAVSAGNVTFNFNGYTLTALNGLNISNGAALGATGTIVGSVENAGTLSPGDLHVNGDYLQAATGNLHIQLASASDFSRLIANGNLALDGTLTIALSDGFMPSVGQTFDILNWGTLNGEFDAVELPAISDSVHWDTSQLYSTGVLSVAANIVGDNNRDGIVDAADYVVWRKWVGYVVSPWTNGDANGNGFVEWADYQPWRENYGRSAANGSGGSAIVAVPEPSALFLVLLGSIMLNFCNRNQRRNRPVEPTKSRCWQHCTAGTV